MIKMRAASNQIDGLLKLISEVKLRDCKTMIEIGSFAGESTSIFAKHFDVVYSVDLWHSHGLRDSAFAYLNEAEKRFDEVCILHTNILKNKMTSEEAAKILPDVDFVYIDGDHRYELVLRDIEIWRPKCRLIGGHDYCNWGSYAGVARAVNEVFEKPSFVFEDLSWLII